MRCAIGSGEPLLRNPITGIAGCYARAASGNTAADPAIPVMKSRRRIAFPGLGTTPYSVFKSGHQNRNLRPAKQEAMVDLRCKKREPRMSAAGHSRRTRSSRAISLCPQCLKSTCNPITPFAVLPARTFPCQSSPSPPGAAARSRRQTHRARRS
jgi:hypothetical protein